MKFHDKRFAEEYDKRLSSENYPGLLLDKVSEKLKKNSSVIDCGAGSGFFSIPLAQRGHRIIAVEPSSSMLNIFERKLNGIVSNNPAGKIPITLCNQSWEDYSGESADYCICIHAVYPMKNPGQALRKMRALCEKTILIARDISKSSSTITDRVRNSLHIESSYKRNEVDVGSILHSVGIEFNYEKVDQKRISVFEDLDREADYYMYHLKLPQSYFIKVKEVLGSLASVTALGYEIDQVYHDVVYIF